jgi:hypothetical protein
MSKSEKIATTMAANALRRGVWLKRHETDPSADDAPIFLEEALQISAQLTDADLLSFRGLGERGLKIIRAMTPFWPYEGLIEVQ